MNKFVIFNKSIGNYLVASGAFLAKTPTTGGALQFKSFEAAVTHMKNLKNSSDCLVIQDTDKREITQNLINNLLKNEANIYSSAQELFSHLEDFSLLLSVFKEQLSDEDKATDDILHKIEFDYLFPKEATAIVNKLHQIRANRRILKDKIDKLEILYKYSKSFDQAKKEYEALIASQMSRNYTPKILKELFDENNI